MAARKKVILALNDDATVAGTNTVTIESVAPKFSDFDGINVPLAPVRMEIAALQKDGLEYMPLSDFLLLVHKCVKEM